MSLSKVQAAIKSAENSCKARGVNLTHKRKQVLSALLQSEKARSAYELADYCKDEFGETLPPMSVYRILDFLQDEHLVHKLKLANKYIACSHITCDHDHGVVQFLICNKCQIVKEITINKAMINKLQRDVENAGFQLASPQLEINCLCHSCKDKAA
jgi:Fur family zinc uptake transcriptional regulator